MPAEQVLRIGITEDHRTPSRVEDYRRWLVGIEPGIEFVLLSHAAENPGRIERLDGLVMTGGGDVHPKFYGRDDLLGQAEGTIAERDVFELKLVEDALERDLPVLAVCRGLQVLNVALGGSLLADVSSSGFRDHRGPGTHALLVDPHAFLYFAAGSREAEVNTSHHQAVDRLGSGLRPSGFSPDGVVEAVEWSSKEGMSFLLGVQWHPERIPEQTLSHNIASLFLRDADHYHRTMISTSHS
jgi:putative glutamine amidotransferase